MTNEQEKLVLEIVYRIGHDAVTDVSPRCCRWCDTLHRGHIAETFTHDPECIVLLCERLSTTLAEEQERA